MTKFQITKVDGEYSTQEHPEKGYDTLEEALADIEVAKSGMNFQDFSEQLGLLDRQKLNADNKKREEEDRVKDNARVAREYKLKKKD